MLVRHDAWLLRAQKAIVLSLCCVRIGNDSGGAFLLSHLKRNSLHDVFPLSDTIFTSYFGFEFTVQIRLYEVFGAHQLGCIQLSLASDVLFRSGFAFARSRDQASVLVSISDLCDYDDFDFVSLQHFDCKSGEKHCCVD